MWVLYETQSLEKSFQLLIDSIFLSQLTVCQVCAIVLCHLEYQFTFYATEK